MSLLGQEVHPTILEDSVILDVYTIDNELHMNVKDKYCHESKYKWVYENEQWILVFVTNCWGCVHGRPEQEAHDNGCLDFYS